MSVKLKHLDVVVLFVTDLERSTAFYRDILGLPLQFEDPQSAVFAFAPITLLLLNIAGTEDLLSPEVVALGRAGGPSVQLVSFVEDVDAVYADLVAQGVEFVREPIDRSWGLRTAHFKDPDGNIWEIAQSLDKTPDEK